MADDRHQSVALVQRVIPDYKVALLGRLVRELDLCVYHSAESPGSEVRDVVTPDFVNKRVWRAYWPGSRTVVFLGGQVARMRARHRAVILEGSAGIASNYVDYYLARLAGARVLAWTFGFDPDRGPVRDTLSDRARVWLFRRADAVIVYWERGRAGLAQLDPTVGEHAFVAPNVVGADLIEPLRSRLEESGRESVKRSLGVDPDAPVIAFIGRLVPVKQCDEFLRLARQLRERYPRVRWLVIGDGPERSALADLAEELGLSDSVTFVGHVDVQAVGEWLYAADVVVVPGRLGLVVSHAVAFGTPVVSVRREVSFHGEGAEYLVPGLTGWWADSLNELPPLLSELLDDPQTLHDIRPVARAYHEEHLSEDATVAGFRRALEYAMHAEETDG